MIVIAIVIGAMVVWGGGTGEENPSLVMPTLGALFTFSPGHGELKMHKRF